MKRFLRTLIPVLLTTQGRSGLYLKNAKKLKEKFKKWRTERNEILVSYDVKNLYPSIPIGKGLELVEKLLRGNRNLKDTTTMHVFPIMLLLRSMFDVTYCGYDGKHHLLDSGQLVLVLPVR